MSEELRAWSFLVGAGLFEVAMALSLKFAEGFVRPAWTLAFLFCAVVSFYLLSRATLTIPIGTAYAVWTGIGAFGTAVLALVVFREPSSFARIFFLTTLIASVVGLKLFSTAQP